MIGVISRSEQLAAVEEFFELFKTPWEMYRPGRTYEVVIATTAQLPELQPRLLVLCGREASGFDRELGIVVATTKCPTILSGPQESLPVYCGLVTFAGNTAADCVLKSGSEVAALTQEINSTIVLRIGYDPFDELQYLITTGQPIENAQFPALEQHIDFLRRSMIEVGIPFVEIPPVPADYRFAVCLTHDIDFVGIRRHFLDHSMFGFAYRGTVGALRNFVKGRLSASQLLRCWKAVASLPFVFAGWLKDFWEPFEWYLEVEKGLPATYFLIPFKRRAGERVPGKHTSRRASAYGVADITDSIGNLLNAGCELGVHGLDSWHSVEKGREELKTVSDATRAESIGIRMHWLLQDENTPAVLEQAGYAYDSTCGFNETPGYRAGATQVFRPRGAQTLLEIPMHIQDGALFYPQRLNLTDAQAIELCDSMIVQAGKYGGVLTLLWHDRSHAPERFWGDFYKDLITHLKAMKVWFGSAAQIVSWFRSRREIRFEEVATGVGARLRLQHEGAKPVQAFTVRVHLPGGTEASSDSGAKTPSFRDLRWTGAQDDNVSEAITQLLSGTAFTNAGYAATNTGVS